MHIPAKITIAIICWSSAGYRPRVCVRDITRVPERLSSLRPYLYGENLARLGWLGEEGDQGQLFSLYTGSKSHSRTLKVYTPIYLRFCNKFSEYLYAQLSSFASSSTRADSKAKIVGNRHHFENFSALSTESVQEVWYHWVVDFWVNNKRDNIKTETVYNMIKFTNNMNVWPKLETTTSLERQQIITRSLTDLRNFGTLVKLYSNMQLC